jgi:hypothetical protein
MAFRKYLDIFVLSADGSHGPDRGHFRLNLAWLPIPRRAPFWTWDAAPWFG